MSESVSRRSDPDRFEIAVDGQVVGFAEFVDRDGVRVFHHTEIAPEFGGRGLAGITVGTALAATREEGLRIDPVCSYVRRYVDTHPEWADLVVTGEEPNSGA